MCSAWFFSIRLEVLLLWNRGEPLPPQPSGALMPPSPGCRALGPRNLPPGWEKPVAGGPGPVQKAPRGCSPPGSSPSTAQPSILVHPQVPGHIDWGPLAADNDPSSDQSQQSLQQDPTQACDLGLFSDCLRWAMSETPPRRVGRAPASRHSGRRVPVPTVTRGGRLSSTVMPGGGSLSSGRAAPPPPQSLRK